MNTNEHIKNKAENGMENILEKAKGSVSHASKEVSKSSKDWIGYIQSHPLQSVLFGIIGYFAIKGLVKD